MAAMTALVAGCAMESLGGSDALDAGDVEAWEAVAEVDAFADPAADPGADPTGEPAGDTEPVDPGADPEDAQPDEAGGETGDAPAEAEVPPPVAVWLVKDGQSSHTIVLQEGASASEKLAAQELVTFVKACTGAELKVVDLAVDPVPPASPMVVLGQGALAKSLGVDPDPAALGDQGFAIRTIPPNVFIAGTAKAGTMYGVHRFLRDFLGVRWIAPGHVTTPAATDVGVPETDLVFRPPFLWRHTSYEWPGGDEDFWARQGDNDGDNGPDDPHGEQYQHDGRAHSYFWYVSPDEFFDTHPEYFSEIGGVRQREETQLCLTNPDVLDIVTERMLQRMADKPNATQHNFSQKDYYNYCECPKCRAMNEQYKTNGGTQFWFVSELAKRTAETYPDKQIGTLAYTYTEEPPQGLDMHPNVAVWLCHMYPSCDSHPIRTCPKNAAYKARAEAWSKLVKHLYVWHYIVDFAHYYNPFPNFRAIADDMRFYRDIGVEGIYLQGMGHAGGGGEFSLLRPYYAMQLLFDPDLDADAVMDDFLQGYHGAAAAPIRQYIDLLHDEVQAEDIHMHLYTNPGQGYLPDGVLDQAGALFDQAEAAVAPTEEMVERVRVARMPLTYARFFPRSGYEIAGGKLAWKAAVAPVEDVQAFIDRMGAHGFTTIREVAGGVETMMLLYSILSAPLDVKTISNGKLAVDVVPMLGGRALRITDVATGKSVTAQNVVPALFFPFAGGLEARVGPGFEAYGWVEPAGVMASSATSISLSSDTLDGWKLERSFTLDPTLPILRVETRATNPGTGTRVSRLRGHLELDLGDLPTTRVKFTDRSGKAVDQDMAGVIAGLREGRHFYDQDAPAGEWTFSGSGGLEVVHRFEAADVDFTWLYAYPEELHELELELWGPRTEVAGGGTLIMRQELEVGPAL
jgi:hypothetical protein